MRYAKSYDDERVTHVATNHGGLLAYVVERDEMNGLYYTVYPNTDLPEASYDLYSWKEVEEFIVREVLF